MKTKHITLLIILIVTVCFGSYLFVIYKIYPDTFEMPKKSDKPVARIQQQDSFYSSGECGFSIDTFSFKGIELGAHFNTFKHIKKTNTPILIYHANIFQKPLSLPRLLEVTEEEIDNHSEITKYYAAKDLTSKAAPETSYEVTNASTLTIFNSEIERMYLRFYSDTLYQIIIFPKSSIVNLIATKFEGMNCLRERSDFKKIYLSNSTLCIESESCDITSSNKNITNVKKYSYIIITNNVLKERKFPEQKSEVKKSKKDDLKDF